MRQIWIACVMLCLLAGCQKAAEVGAGLPDEAIAVTPLDGPAPVAADAPAAEKPDPAPVAEPQISTPPEAEAPKTAEQMLCEKSDGQWVSAGDTGAFYCASQTRDGGKRCTKQTQCQGACLARSGTCSPVTPLYGCNDVLEKDGRQVTLCID